MKSIYFILLFITFSVNAQQIETIDWDEVHINGILELTISKRDFESIYKKADSIITPDYTEICGADEDSNFQYYYYKGLQYELDNGIMNFRKITFSKKYSFFILYKDKKIDLTTKIGDLNTLFPEAIKNAENNNGIIYITLKSADVIDDSEWRFTFQNGHLQYIECFFSC